MGKPDVSSIRPFLEPGFETRTTEFESGILEIAPFFRFLNPIFLLFEPDFSLRNGDAIKTKILRRQMTSIEKSQTVKSQILVQETA
jgi:hypothetical protein